VVRSQAIGRTQPILQSISRPICFVFNSADVHTNERLFRIKTFFTEFQSETIGFTMFSFFFSILSATILSIVNCLTITLSIIVLDTDNIRYF